MTFTEPEYITTHDIVPEGQYNAIIEDVEQYYFSPDEEVDCHGLNITWLVNDEGISDTLRIVQWVVLDVTSDDQIDMDKGANRELNSLRDELGQNNYDWNFMRLKGVAARITISHKVTGIILHDVITKVRAI